MYYTMYYHVSYYIPYRHKIFPQQSVWYVKSTITKQIGSYLRYMCEQKSYYYPLSIVNTCISNDLREVKILMIHSKYILNWHLTKSGLLKASVLVNES